jgi:hypothetical protein
VKVTVFASSTGVDVAVLTAVGRAVAVGVGVAVSEAASFVRVGVLTLGVNVGGAVGEVDGVARSDAVDKGVTVTGVATSHPAKRNASSATAQESHVRCSV